MDLHEGGQHVCISLLARHVCQAPCTTPFSLSSSCAHAACRNTARNQEQTCVYIGTGKLGNSMTTNCSRPVGKETAWDIVSLTWDMISSDATACSAQPSQQQLALKMGMSRGEGLSTHPEARSHTQQGQLGGRTGSLLGCPPHA